MTSRRILLAGGGAIISAVAIAIVVATMDVGDAAPVLGSANPAPLLAMVAVVAMQVVIRAFRWSILIPGPARLPIGRLIPPLLAGYLGNAVLPARLGEPMRAIVMARRERVGMPEALGSVLLERGLDVVTLAAVAFAAASIVDAPSWIVRVLGALAFIGIAGVALLVTVGLQPLVRLAERVGIGRRPTLHDIVARLTATIGGSRRRRAILAAAALSASAWLLDASLFWLAGQAVGADVSYAGAMLIAGVTVLGTAIPAAPGYVGTFELAAVATAALIGVPGGEALALAIAAHVMTLAPVAIGGAVSLVLMGTRFGELARTAEVGRHA